MLRYFTFILCIFFAITLTIQLDAEEESKQRFKNAVTQCTAEFPDDKDVKPRIYCISKIAKWQNEDGSVNKEVIRQRAEALFSDPVKREEVYNDCAQQKDTPVETAYHILSCYKKYVKVNL